MKHFRQGQRGPAYDVHRSGSPLDPVLNGVAQGLAALFPPVETGRSHRQHPARTEGSERRSDEAASTRTPNR